MDPMGRAYQSLQGLAYGDAFGQQWFSVPSTPAEPVPAWSSAVARRETLPGPWPWTDDTAQACVLLRELGRDEGRIDPDRLAAGFADAYAAEPYRGYGGSMHDVLRRIGAGEPWPEVVGGQFGGQGSWGNGAAMRAAPLGAHWADDPDRAAAEAATASAVTHAHPEAIAGGIAVAVAAALAAAGAGAAAAESGLFLAEVADRTPEGEVRSGLTIASRFAEGTSVQHASAVLGSGRRISAPDTVPFALWTAAVHLDDLVEGLWATASAGGDMDTTCAITGGVIAARTGTGAVPQPWREAREPLPGPDWPPRAATLER